MPKNKVAADYKREKFKSLLSFPGIQKLRSSTKSLMISYEGTHYELFAFYGDRIKWRIDSGAGFTDFFFGDIKYFRNRYLEKAFTVPFNSGKQWTDGENSVFEEMVALDSTINQIANELERHPLAIKVKLRDFTGFSDYLTLDDADWSDVAISDINKHLHTLWVDSVI